MDKIRTVGVDLAKNVFHVAAFDGRGREVGCKRLRRGQLLAYFAQRPPCVVGLEACASAHHWARQLQGLGHRVRLIAAQYVRAYRRGQKNDYNGARASVGRCCDTGRCIKRRGQRVERLSDRVAEVTDPRLRRHSAL